MDVELRISADEQSPRDAGALSQYGEVFDVLASGGLAPARDAKDCRLRRRGRVTTAAAKISMSARWAGDHIVR